MVHQHLFRSLIFVPGNNPRFLHKAKSLQADIVCLDLEDSVPGDQKADARRLIRQALESYKEAPAGHALFVRTNPPSSKEITEDLGQIIQDGVDGVVIPKVDGAQDLQKIEVIISKLEKERGLEPIQMIPSIESAQGVVNAFEISSFGQGRVCAVVFGVFDLLNDLGIEYTKGVAGAAYARQKIPVDARAAGVAAIDAIWQDLTDQKGLEDDCKAGKGLGYAGKSVIHPDHIPVVHRLYHPNKGEILWAEKICNAYRQSLKEGRGATAIDGKMIDKVHFKQAKALLDLAQKRQP